MNRIQTRILRKRGYTPSMQIGSGTYARVFTDKQNNEILLRVEDILPDNPLRDAKMTIKLQKQLAVHGIAPELYESFEVPRDRHDRKEVKKFLVPGRLRRGRRRG